MLKLSFVSNLSKLNKYCGTDKIYYNLKDKLIKYLLSSEYDCQEAIDGIKIYLTSRAESHQDFYWQKQYLVFNNFLSK